MDDTAASSTTTYSSTKIQQVIADVGGVAIDDTTASTTTVYSSSKTENLINTSLSQLKELLYPVGCIVQTTAYSTTAQMIAAYGGQDWELIEDRVLMGASSPLAATQKYVVNQTGGSDTVTLTTANLPSHNHSYTNTIVGNTTLTTSQIPSHSHSTFASAVPWGSDWNDNQRQMTCRSASERTWTETTGTAGGGGSHTHPDVSRSKTTGDTGSGTAVSIVQSYYTVYIWTRTV